MSILTLYKGKKGEKGASGLDGVDTVRPIIDNPLLKMFAPNNLSSAPVAWSRVSEASVVDRYDGVNVVGGDLLENLLTYSNDFSQWIDINNNWDILSTNNSDPQGGNAASELDLTALNTNELMTLSVTFPTASDYTLSFWIKSTSGTVDSVGGNIGSNSKLATETITTSWQRISVTITSIAASAVVDIIVNAASGVKFQLYGVQLERGSRANDYIPTTGAIVSNPNPENRWRSNQYGYLIEQPGSNLVPFSEDLGEVSEWSIAGATVATYSSADVFGELDKRIKLTSDIGTSITLSGGGTYTTGVEYSVSLWVKLISGSASAIAVSVGNGGTVSFDDAPTSEFKRIFITTIAGSDNNINITITAPNGDAVILVEGIQAEANGISSYVRTSDVSALRTADLVTIDYQPYFVKPSLPWSVLFTLTALVAESGDRFVFHNGLTGSDEFYCKFTGEFLEVKSGTDTVQFTFTGALFELVFNGVNLSYYSNGLLIDSQALAGTTALGTTLNVCSDDGGINQIDTPISLFMAYDEALTQDELRYIRGTNA